MQAADPPPVPDLRLDGITLTMISESWLKERLETTDAQDLFKRELMSFGLSDSDLHELLARGPSPRWAGKWREFLGQMVAGDELWFFESPPETWSTFAGRAGYALVRSGHIVDFIVSRKS
jgi:hypothetical protein